MRMSKLRRFFIALFFLHFTSLVIAEGTRELSPTPSDELMLLINSNDYGDFGVFDGLAASRLNISIWDDTVEEVFFGLSCSADNLGAPDGGYWFQVKDPLGNVVHGPFFVDCTTANANTHALAAAGPDVLSAGGYDTSPAYASFNPTSGIGDYYVEFSENMVGNGFFSFNIKWFDITVVANGVTEMPGRINSRNWAFRSPTIDIDPPDCDYDREFNGAVYSYTQDGFVTKLDFANSGFKGLAFSLVFNSTGPGTSGNLIIDRRSVNFANATLNAAEHRIFLNEPDIDCFPSSQDACGEATLSSVSCDGSSYCINVDVENVGQIEVLLDFFGGNGVFDPGTEDVLIVESFTATSTVCLEWDLLDGLGNSVDPTGNIPLVLTYTQGVQHYSAFDVERLENGFCVETIRPICSALTSDLLYWDDSNIVDDFSTTFIDESDPGTGQPTIQLAGCSCQTGGCRTWTNFQVGEDASNCDGSPHGYGEASTLNTWWFAATTVSPILTVALPSVDVVGVSEVCPGDETEFSVTSTLADISQFDYSWTGPNGFVANTATTGSISEPGEYCVTVIDGISGCTMMDCLTLSNAGGAGALTCPPTSNINCGDVVPEFATLTEFLAAGGTVGDAAAVLSFTLQSSVTVSGACPAYETVTNTYAITDDCAVAITCEHTIIISDATPPSIMDCPIDVTVECGDSTDPADTGTAVPGPDGCGDDVLSFSDVVMGGNCPDEMIVMRTWSVTDGCGTAASCTQNILISDFTPPLIIDPIPDDVTVECASLVPAPATLAVTDNCGASLMIMPTDVISDMTCANSFTITRTWTVSDPCNNVTSGVQIITVNDTTNPVITCPTNISISCSANLDPANTGMATATDNCGGAPVITFTDVTIGFDGTCTGNTIATVERTFVATDACGLSSSCTQIITLIDDVAPIAVCQDITVDFAGSNTVSIVPSQVDGGSSDACGSNLTFSLSQTDFDCTTVGVSETVTLTVTDECGNSSSCTATVTFLSSTLVDLGCPSDTVVVLASGLCGDIVNYDIFASNACGVIPDVTQTDGTGFTSGDYFEIGTYFQSYQAINSDGDTATCEFTIEVVEATIDNTSLTCVGQINFSLDENCEGLITPTMIIQGEIGCEDNYEIIVCAGPNGPDIPTSPMVTGDYIGDTLYVKACEITTGLCCWGIVVIQDKGIPDLVCENDTIACADDIDPFVLGFPADGPVNPILIGTNTYQINGIDACGGATLSYDDTVIPQPCSSPYIKLIQRDWDIVDDYGNSSSCTEEIYILRSQLEDVTLPPDFDGIANPMISCNSSCAIQGLPTSCTGEPGGLNCDNLIAVYEDEILPLCGPNYKVLRTWTILDWCTSEFFLHYQVIKVQGDGPTINCPADMTIGAFGYGCTGTTQLPMPDVFLACNNNDYTYTYEVEVENGTVSSFGQVYQVSGLLLGDNEVTYIATDECGNTAECSMTVTVVDDIPPVAICDEFTVISLNATGEVTVDAIGFDDGSYDYCEIDYFEIRRVNFGPCNNVSFNTTNFGPTVSFCCEDVAQGPIMLELRVWDVNGNSNICSIEATIQDKVAPEIECPADITLTCGDDIDLVALSNVLDDTYGTISVSGNCNSYNIDIEVFDNRVCGLSPLDANGNYLPAISRYATVNSGNGTSQCFQNIYIIDNDPFNGNDITWPQNYDLGCMDDTDPESLPDGFDVPDYQQAGCGLIAVSYEDAVFYQEDGFCMKILRTWTVIDWCQFDQLNPGANGIWTFTQVVRVDNTTAPVITSACSNVSVCAFSDTCQGEQIELTATAEDDCDGANLDWEYEIDAFNDGSIDITGSTNDATGDYPVGTHTITWTVTDQCGNSSSCSYQFEITDCKKPTPVCINGLSTVIMPTTGEVTIWASDFEAGSSFDNCTDYDDLQFSFSSDVNETSLTITCDDIPNGMSASIMVQIWVTDEAGNQDFCETFILVTDNDDVCTDISLANVDIFGTIMTENNLPVSEVNVYLKSNDPAIDDIIYTTTESGNFAFSSVEVGHDYNLTPFRDDNYINGVTTLDLVAIQKHLLGIQSLDSPYKMIAADANNSSGVSAIDIIEIRKLILGAIDDFPHNYSWRFVQDRPDAMSPNNPWPFTEMYDYLDLNSSELQEGFVAVKVGDVNQSASTFLTDLEDRNDDELLFSIQDRLIKSGEKVDVSIAVNQDVDLSAFQFTLASESLRLLSMNAPSLVFNNYNSAKINESTSTVSWHDITSAPLKAGDIILNISFVATESGQLSEMMEFGSDITELIFYDKNSNSYTANFNFEKTSVKDEDLSFALYQNVPNPFEKQTRVDFYLPSESDFVLNIYNIEGSLIKQIADSGSKGVNSLNITADESLSAGIYYYQLSAGSHTATKKLTIIK